jgi:hypothetical protein
MDAEDERWSFTGSDNADSKANEVLEGERKARSVGTSVQLSSDGRSAENARVQAERQKGAGGATKPNVWLRRVVKR